MIEVKSNLVQKLKKELERGPKGVYGIGTVTDPYQPVEREHELTRGCLLALRRVGARVSILTKSDMVLRDIDLLTSWTGAEVGISVSTLNEDLASIVEPGAPSPRRRFDALRKLSSEGVSVYLMFAPVIPSLSDSDEHLRAVVQEAATCSVPRMIWDKFNPKPMATARLRRALAEKDMELSGPHSPSDTERIRRLLSEECSAPMIELLDAF